MAMLHPFSKSATANKKLRRAVLSVLGGLASVSLSSTAHSTNIQDNDIPVGSNTGTTGSGLPYVWDGGNIGFGNGGTPAGSTKGHPFYAPEQARVGGAGPMGNSTVDTAKNLGWNHNMTWRAFQIVTPGGYTINVDRTSTGTSYQPAFSLFTSGNTKWDAAGSSHSFNQVAAPAPVTNIAARQSALNFRGNATSPPYMVTDGGSDITGFVGYANSGPSYTNAEGFSVLGALAFGQSEKGPLQNPALPYKTDSSANSPANLYTSLITKGAYTNQHAGEILDTYKGVGWSINTNNPTLENSAGGGHVDVNLWLPAGWYVIGVGGSCADFTCTPTSASSGNFRITVLPNVNVTAPVTNTPPTLTSVTTLTGATAATAYPITYANLVSAAPDLDDDDNDTLSFRIESVTSGTLTKNGAAITPGTTLLASGESLSWTPSATGTVEAFKIVAWDGKAASSPAVAVNITVASGNVAPSFVGATTSISVPKDGGAVDLKPYLHVSDSNASQTLTWTQSTAPAHGTLTITSATATSGNTDITPGGTLTYTPATGYTGSDTLTIQVSDGNGGTATRTLNITVTDTNIAPSFVGGSTSLALPKGSAAVDLKPNLHVSDSNTGQTLTWSLTSAPAHGTLALSGATATSGSTDVTPGGTITYTPTSDYTGSDSFTIQVSDGTATAVRAFSVTMASGNIAPSFVGGTTSLTVDKDAAALDLKPNLHVSDTDTNQTLTWTQTTAPSHGTLTISAATATTGSTDITPGGTLTYKPTAGYTGSDSFTIQVADGQGGTVSRAFTVAVGNTSTNEPPVADAGADSNVAENELVTLNGSASRDPEGTTLKYQWTQIGGPTVTLTGATTAKPSLTAPKVNTDTYLGFNLVVTDSDPSQPRTSNADTVRVLVRHTPTTPIAQPAIAVVGGNTVLLDGSASTAGRDITSYAWSQKIIGTEPRVALTVDPDNPARASFKAPQTDTLLTFQLVVTDRSGLASAPSVRTVRVARNQPPEAHADDRVSIRAGSVMTLNGSGSFDPDGDPLSFAWRQIGGQTVVLSSTTAPKPTFTAPLTAAGQTLGFALKVSDDKSASTTTTVSVQVTDDNNPPTAKITAQPVTEGAEVTLNTTASDPDGDATTYLWQQTSGTPVVLTQTDQPSLSFTAPWISGDSEELSFSLTVTDGFSPNPKSVQDQATVRINSDPNRLDCANAVASPAKLWPANRGMVAVAIGGVSGPGPYRLTVNDVNSDEPVQNKALGDTTSPDAKVLRGKATATQSLPADRVLLRAERQVKRLAGILKGNGRVYTVSFTADDGAHSCVGAVKVEVPSAPGEKAVEDNLRHNAVARKISQ